MAKVISKTETTITSQFQRKDLVKDTDFKIDLNANNFDIAYYVDTQTSDGVEHYLSIKLN